MKINKELENIIIVIVILLAISITILPDELNDLDEIWNYNFARNVAEDRLPYRDFNMLQMPLLPIIAGMFLKVFGNELIVMRVLAIILCTAILFVVYKILKQLKLNKYVIAISLFVIYLLFTSSFCIDYNLSILLIALLAIYSEIKQDDILEYSLKKDFLLGILIGTSILFKQTTGLVISIIFIFYKLLLVNSKDKWKIVKKIILTRLLGVLVPVLLLIGYLLINNIMYDFLDYTIYSIKTFSNKIPYTSLLIRGGVSISFLSMILPITILYMYYQSVVKTIKTQEQKNLFILFAFSVACFTVVFPISNRIHFLIGSLPALIAFIYILSMCASESIEQYSNLKIVKFIKEYLKAVVKITLLALIIYFITFLVVCFANMGKYTKYKHFKYIPEEMFSITEIDNFILEKENEGKKVYILDASAAVYMIPLDKYNKNFDMFLKGNLGSKGEQGQIEKLEQMDDNVLVMIMDEEHSRNWQNPEEVRTYIVEKWKKTGEKIIKYDVYIRK